MAKKKKKSCVDANHPRVLDEGAVIAFCNTHNMTCHFSVLTLFIKTPFGSWYMDPYTPIPNKIKLYHGNANPNHLKVSKKCRAFDADYHYQGKAFDNVLDALDYIYCHDFNKLKRENKIKNGDSLIRKLNEIQKDRRGA